MFRVVIPTFFSAYTQHPRSFLNHHLTDLGRLYTRGFINITSTSEALVMLFFLIGGSSLGHGHFLLVGNY